MYLSLKRSQFARNVAVLSSGTAAAQAIPIAVSPLLTRLYPPDEFGLVALYVSCVSVLSVIATMRYEMAIVLPSSDRDAANLAALSLKICAAVSLTLYLAIVPFGGAIAVSLGNQHLAPWLWLLPVSVFAIGASNIFLFWSNRKSLYRLMAVNKIQHSAWGGATKTVLGFIGVNGGQILGAFVGSALSTFWLGARVLRDGKSFLRQITSHGQWAMARRYSNHPRHIVPSQLIGTIALQLPIFLISSVYSIADAGLFSLAYQLVSLPTGLVANAVGDVYRQRIAVAYNEKGDFSDIFLSTLKTTFLLSLVPFAALYFIAPELFAFAFGPSWRISGEYAQVLVVAAYFQFVFTPMDKGALVVGATTYIFIWNAARCTSLAALFIWASVSRPEVATALWILVAINVLFYLMDGWMQLVFSSAKRRLQPWLPTSETTD